VAGGNAQLGLEVLLLLLIVVVFFLSWRVARWLLRPRDLFGLEDESLSRLETLRSYVGFGVVLVATLPVRGSPNFIADYLIHIAEALLVGAAVVVACLVVTVLLSDHRVWLVGRTWRPLWRMALTFGPLYLGLFLGGLPIVTRTLNISHPTIQKVFIGGYGGWLVLALLWLILFSLFALCYSARFLYCPGEVHPLLAPLAAGVAVTAIAVLDVSRAMGWLTPVLDAFGRVMGRTTPEYDTRPSPIWLGLILTACGWFSTLALAALEWRALRAKGVHLREIPLVTT
jgi:hypothetical protein